MYDLSEDSPHWSMENTSNPSNPQHVQGDPAQPKAVVLHKDPIMLLNEHCQRNQLKVSIMLRELRFFSVRFLVVSNIYF